MISKLKSKSAEIFIILITVLSSLSIIHNLREYEDTKEEILRLEIRKIKLEIQLLNK